MSNEPSWASGFKARMKGWEDPHYNESGLKFVDAEDLKSEQTKAFQDSAVEQLNSLNDVLSKDWDFSKAVKDKLETMKELLTQKNKGYSSSHRLDSFIRPAEFRKKPPIEIAFDYLVKHFISVQVMLEGAEGDGIEDLESRFMDIACYGVLGLLCLDYQRAKDGQNS